jgi:hypothetical protein
MPAQAGIHTGGCHGSPPSRGRRQGARGRRQGKRGRVHLFPFISAFSAVMPAQAGIHTGGCHGSPPSRGRRQGARGRRQGKRGRRQGEAGTSSPLPLHIRVLRRHAREGGHPYRRLPWVPAFAGTTTEGAGTTTGEAGTTTEGAGTTTGGAGTSSPLPWHARISPPSCPRRRASIPAAAMGPRLRGDDDRGRGDDDRGKRGRRLLHQCHSGDRSTQRTPSVA